MNSKKGEGSVRKGLLGGSIDRERLERRREPLNSHVEVAEVDGGADEARGGVVAGALPREAQPPPRRQRQLHRPAPPPAHSPRPDGQR